MGGKKGRNMTWKKFLQVKCENVNFDLEKGISATVIA